MALLPIDRATFEAEIILEDVPRTATSPKFLYFGVPFGVSVSYQKLSDLSWYFRSNFIAIDVYFAQLKYESITQLKAYDLGAFFGKKYVCSLVRAKQYDTFLAYRLFRSPNLTLNLKLFLTFWYSYSMVLIYMYRNNKLALISLCIWYLL